MKLIETDSLWGNLYRKRYYINGVRVGADTFRYEYTNRFTAEQGVQEKTSFGYRKTWKDA